MTTRSEDDALVGLRAKLADDVVKASEHPPLTDDERADWSHLMSRLAHLEHVARSLDEMRGPHDVVDVLGPGIAATRSQWNELARAVLNGAWRSVLKRQTGPAPNIADLADWLMLALRELVALDTTEPERLDPALHEALVEFVAIGVLRIDIHSTPRQWWAPEAAARVDAAIRRAFEGHGGEASTAIVGAEGTAKAAQACAAWLYGVSDRTTTRGLAKHGRGGVTARLARVEKALEVRRPVFLARRGQVSRPARDDT